MPMASSGLATRRRAIVATLRARVVPERSTPGRPYFRGIEKRAEREKRGANDRRLSDGDALVNRSPADGS